MPRVNSVGFPDSTAATTAYWIFNSNHKPLYVLAESKDDAWSIALAAAHVYQVYQRPGSFEERGVHKGLPMKISKMGSAKIARAMAIGKRGSITISDDSVRVGSGEIEL